MSTVLMGQCWPLQMPPTAKAVLMSLADQANDAGVCWPAVGTICERTCLSERTVQNAIKWLCESGVLLVNRTPGRSTNYQINPAGFGAGTIGLFDAPRRGDDGRRPMASGSESHYVYRIEDTATGEFYIGVRSCRGAPERDGYMGSGAWFSQRVSAGSALRKVILSRHETREAADLAERDAIVEARVDPLCRNQRTPAAGAPRTTCTPQLVRGAAHARPPAAGAPTPAAGAPRTTNNHQGTDKKKRLTPPPTVPASVLVEAGFTEQQAQDFIDHKARLKAPLTERAWADHLREAAKAGWTPVAAAEKVMAKSWKGFEAKYVANETPPPAAPGAAPAGPWHETMGGIKAMGAELEVPYTREDECHPFERYKAKVFKAAGHSPRAAA